MQKFLSQPFHVAEQFTGIPGKYVKVEDTIKGFKEILGGMPEGCLFVTGTGEEIRGLGYDRLLRVVSADLKIYARTGEN